MSQHWDQIYLDNSTTDLDWYQEEPQPDFGLIENLSLDRDIRILLAGVGTSTLVKMLSEEGYTNLILNDISQSALDKLKKEIGDNPYEWIVDDLTMPEKLPNIPLIDLWYDRAVLHFFVEERQQNIYRQLIHSKVRPEGYVILAQYATTGSNRSSRLPIKRYSPKDLQEFLGENFKSIHFLDYTYIQPSGGLRPFIYGVFQRSD